MDWMRAGLLWGTGIAFASGLLLAFVFWLSNSNDRAELKPDGLVHSAVTADGKLVVPFAPYRVRVETLGAGSTISHVNFRVVVDDDAKKQHLCRRLPMVMEVLDVAIGGKALSESEWLQLKGTRFAALLRWRINRALRAEDVERVIIDRNGPLLTRIGACPT